MKIFKPYEKEKPEVRCNCCGNIMEPEYKERYDDSGHPYLEKSEKSTPTRKSRAIANSAT